MKSFHIISGLMLVASAATAQQYTITTVAGYPKAQGFYGDGGQATSAELDMPTRVAVDSKGNYFIADYLTHIVRQVTSAGVISTIAGTGANSFSGDGGPAVQAAISDVHGLAVDSSGNVYIADTGNSRVRKIDTKGTMTTLAGNGTFGYSGDGAAATSAALERPSGVAVDGSGNVYIADYGNSTVRKVASSGTITTIAGTGSYGFSGDGGPANKALLSTPYAITLDPAGNIYISDTSNQNIRKITGDGNIQTVVSNVDAESIAVDAAGTLYYPNYTNNTVQKVTQSGAQLTIAGNGRAGYSGDGGAATSAQLNLPYGVAIDTGGKIYVADSSNQIVRLLTPVSASIGIVNAASGIGGQIAPGEIVLLYGTGLGPATLAVNTPVNGFYGSQAAGTTVSFDGIPAPILYSSATQVAAIVPYAEPVGGTAQLTVTYQGQSQTASVPVTRAVPGVFTLDSSGSGQVAAVNVIDGSINSAAHPAPIGTYVSLYSTGDGWTLPDSIDGKLATAPYPATFLPTQVSVAGQPATVSYSGGAAGAVAGLTQVNIRIPALNIQAFAAGALSVPVTLQDGRFFAQPGLTIFVSAQ